jgi:hypothetical protein
MGAETALAIGVKRKGDQVIENKQSREATDLAPPMISMAYEQVAKPFVSLSEMNPRAFAGFPARPGPKRKDREIDGGLRLARTLRDSATRKWRRKSLESLKSDSEMARGRCAGKENRSDELGIRP